MPELRNDRWWFTPDDGRASADFGADPRPSRNIGALDVTRPRNDPAPLEMNPGGIPRFNDYRRGNFGIPVQVSGVGDIVSGNTYVYAYSLAVSNPVDYAVNLRLALCANQRLVWLIGTVTTAVQVHSGIVGGHAGIFTPNLSVRVFDVNTGLVIPAESYPSTLIFGTVATAPMD